MRCAEKKNCVRISVRFFKSGTDIMQVKRHRVRTSSPQTRGATAGKMRRALGRKSTRPRAINPEINHTLYVYGGRSAGFGGTSGKACSNTGKATVTLSLNHASYDQLNTEQLHILKTLTALRTPRTPPPPPLLRGRSREILSRLCIPALPHLLPQTLLLAGQRGALAPAPAPAAGRHGCLAAADNR